MDSDLVESCDAMVGDVCQKGCGLELGQQEQTLGPHCCLTSLKNENASLFEKSTRMEQEFKYQSSRWNKRERYLMSQLLTAENEIQLIVLEYQKKFSRCVKQLDNISRSVPAVCKVRAFRLHSTSCKTKLHNKLSLFRCLWLDVLSNNLHGLRHVKKICCLERFFRMHLLISVVLLP